MGVTRVMVTGHRPNKLVGHEQWVQDSLLVTLDRIRARNPSIEAISGMAVGVDTMFALMAFRLGIPLLAAVPFEGQEALWPYAAQDLYQQLLAKAARVEIISTGGYAPWKLLRRNTWMVEQATFAIVVWDGEPSGGTYHAVGEIRQKGLPNLWLNPKLRRVGKL